MARHACFGSIGVALVLAAAVGADSQRRTESLLPSTTKAFLSVPDVGELQKRWERTQLGQLMNDPVMKPFVEDLKRQWQAKLDKAGLRLGLTWDDLRGVYGGEVCLAMIQPDGDEKQHALVLLVDTTGREKEATELLERISKRLLATQARREVRKLGDVEMVVFTLAKRAEQSQAQRICQFRDANWIVASDHAGAAERILGRLRGQQGKTLEEVPAFIAAMQRSRQASGDLQPQIRWFVEPFGYAETLRAAAGGRKRRGVDTLKALARQGFRAIQGVGGYAMLATGEHELLLRAMVYAPPAARGPGDPSKDKYTLAARMLNFPNAKGLAPQPWIPRDLAAYVTFHWKMKEAFEFSKTLVNELADDEIFEDVLEGIRTDPDGPQVDMRKELIAYLGERATLLTDHREPVTPKSERLLFAVEVTDADAVTRAINKVMATEPDAHRREFQGHVIWEILREPQEVVQLKLEAADFDMFLAEHEAKDQEQDKEQKEEEEEAAKPLFANPAVTVAYGQMIFASHIDFVQDVLTQRDQRDLLAQARDYQVIANALEKLGAGADCIQAFVRVDEACAATYELIRQGKMPQSKSLLGKLLNRLLGSEEEGVLRQQQIDGANMPDYQTVRRHVGPAGVYARSEEDGWFVSGCMLSKDVEY